MNWKILRKSIIHTGKLVSIAVGIVLMVTLPYLLSIGVPIVLVLIGHNTNWLFLYIPIGYGWVVYFDYEKRKETGKGLLDYLSLDEHEN